MVNNQEATPAAAPAAPATPSNGDAGKVTPPSAAATIPSGDAGKTQVGMVTIPVSEFAQLTRDAARGRSPKGTRVYTKPVAAATIDPDDPNASALAIAEAARADAERRAMRLEVQSKVRDLLADERFKNVPQSTKSLVLERPYLLTEASTLEDAMYDIEDELIKIAGSDTTIPVTVVPGATPGRETPPVVTPGAPAPVDAGTIIDTANLRGPARSQAVLRNSMTKARSGQQT